MKFTCGVDVLEFNPAQTAAYLASRCDICPDSLSSTIDLNNRCDILNWELNGAETATQAVTYTTPAADGAPWYDASIPESATFLGYMVSRAEKPSHISREITQRISGSGGGVLETLRPGPQVWDVEVYLFGCDEASVEYGMRYLSNIITDGGCESDNCEMCEVEIRDTCPSFTGTPTVDEFNTGRWLLYNASMTRSPEWTDPPAEGTAHYVRKARFQFASELPWKFKPGETCSDEEEFTLTTPTLGCGADFDSWFCAPTAVRCSVTEALPAGETGFIITIRAGVDQPLYGVSIEITPDPTGDVCAGIDPGTPDEVIYFNYVPTNRSIIYDTTTEKVWLRNTGGTLFDGTPYMTFDGGSPPVFPNVRCGDYCVSVIVDECSVSSGAFANIETVHREY